MSVKPTDLAACRALMKHHGRSYWEASRLFPRSTRDATTVLYTFFRLADEFVHNPDDLQEAAGRLKGYRRQWEGALARGESGHPVLRATAEVVRTHRIPPRYIDRFLQTMQTDLHVTRYATYRALTEYMDGSAAAVGVMMSYVIGFSDEAALGHAARLGYAMQLTNFLRDIEEDYQRGRIYLPAEDRQRFGVTEEMFAGRRCTPELRGLLRFEIDRCRGLYAAAEPGIALLESSGRRGVRVASRLYAGILSDIEHRNYDIFGVRASLSSLDKVRLALGARYA